MRNAAESNNQTSLTRKTLRCKVKHKTVVSRYSETSIKRTALGTFLRVRLIEGVRLIEVCKNCAINFQRLLCKVIKFLVVKEAVLYLVQDFRSNLQFIDS